MEEVGLSTKTSFLQIMGGSPINRVLDFLIENDRESWSMNEISENANVGYSTLKMLMPHLVKNKLVIIVKKIGKIGIYTINKENPIIKKLYLLRYEANKAMLMNR